MKEKVYSVNNYWDMTILEGIADFKGQPYHYTNIFSDSEDNWTDEYLLTPLPENIFRLSVELCNYWLYWLETYNQTKIPHPVEYEKQRQNPSFETLKKSDIESEEWIKAEQNYQRQTAFDKYLKANSPITKAKGIFSGGIDGMETFVEWTEL